MTDSGEAVWKALGRLVARYLMLKKAVQVPKFGTFTLTSSPIDLDGITNPTVRSRDLREPVFVISSDFCPSTRPGISHSTGIRPYTDKGFSGKVPTLSLNYTELANIAGIEKEVCKRALDGIIRDLSDSAKAGSDVRKPIGALGTFVVKSGVAAVVFDESALKPAAVPTKKAALDGSQWLGSLENTEKSLHSRPATSQLLSDPGTKTVPNVRSLLTSPVDFLLENQARVMLLWQMKDQGNTGLLSLEEVQQAVRALENSTLTDDLINQLISLTNCRSNSKIRYRDLLTGLRKFKTPTLPSSSKSDFTDNYSRSSIVPLARRIWDSKVPLTDLAQKNGMRPRLKTTASDLLSVLKRGNLNVNIHQLKAFLREDQLDVNSVSVLDLVLAARSILKPETADLSVFSDILSQKSEQFPSSFRDSDKMQTFFQSHPLTDVFFRARNEADVISLSSFLRTIQELSHGSIKSFEAQREFMKASKGKTEMTAGEFWGAFQMRETKKQVEERGMRVVRQWMREEKVTPEEGFQKLMERSRATERMTRQQFQTALSDFSLSHNDIEILFTALDTKRDQFLDLPEWLTSMYQSEGPLQSIKDLWAKSHIPKEELQQRLNLEGKELLTESDLIGVIQRIDTFIGPQRSKTLAEVAMKGRDVLPVSELISHLTAAPTPLTIDWLDSISRLIRQKLSGQPQRLRNLFESSDLKHIGRLSASVFQDCLSRAGLGLNSDDIHRLTTVLDPNNVGIINFNTFLDKLIGPEYISQDPLRTTTERLSAYLRQNSVTAEQLLSRMGGSVPILTFANFLGSKVHQKLSVTELVEIASKMDVNADGMIDAGDINATVSARNWVNVEGKKDGEEEGKMSVEEAREVLTDLRHALQRKKISYPEAFQRLDSDGNGLIPFPHFLSNLDSLMPLSDTTKTRLFRLFDPQAIGLIDYPTFLKVLRDTDIDPKQKSDSWEWEQDVISKIKSWASASKLSIESVFRAFDRDFDGVLSKADLRDSLQSILKIEDLPAAKLDRLYKLLDAFKRDSVQLADFKVIFEENRRPDWKSSAKQQLGIYLSKTYPSLSQSFEQVSELSGKVTFSQFQHLVESKSVLSGFNLTTNLLQELFADIDFKRKGFISESDWTTAFGGYQHKQLSFSELKDTLRSNFVDIEAAFDFFLSFHTGQPPGKLLISEFEAAIESLIPKRFTKVEVKGLWERISGGRSYIDGKEFAGAFSDVRFMSNFGSRKGSRQTSERGSARSASTSRLSALSDDDPFRRLHSLLKTSPRPLESLFRDFDPSDSGHISANDFRNALRSLTLGLTARDIDQLLYRIDANNDGNINYLEFARKFQPTEAEQRIKTVTQQRMNKLREYMFSYMISPRDAFRLYDAGRSGRLEFAAFNSLVRKLYDCSGEPVPAFSVLKDLFDAVDSRSDGYLDIKEWLSAFRQDKGGRGWSGSKMFEDVVKNIGKNRKMLQMTFEAMSTDGKVTYQGAKDVLSTVLKGIDLTEDQWREVIRVGEKEGGVDFRLLLDVYRERTNAGDMHPRA